MTDHEGQMSLKAAESYAILKGLQMPADQVAASTPFQSLLATNGPGKAGDLPGFDSEWYARQLEGLDQDQDPASICLFRHFVDKGSAQGLTPHPVLTAVPDKTDTAGIVPPLFDTAAWQDVMNGLDWPSHPILHFLARWQDTRAPFSAHVSTAYLSHQLRQDFQDSDPLTVYYRRSVVDRPDPHPLFDGTWYRDQHELAEDQDAFEHFLTTGIELGLAPNPYCFPDIQQHQGQIPRETLLSYLNDKGLAA